MPKISVIVPVFQVENFIEKSATSLLNQSMEDVEYIFVDDKSADKSVEVLKQVLDRYPMRRENTRIVVQESNQGAPRTRYNGLKYASGDYIFFCDSDDEIEFQMLEKMYKTALEDDSDVVICQFDCRNGGKVYGETGGIALKPDKIGILNDLLYQKQSWSLFNKLFKRSLFDNPVSWPYDNMGDDMTIVLQLLYYADKISFIPEVLYHYDYNPSSIINTINRNYCISKFEGYKRNYAIIRDFYSDKPEFKELEHGFDWLRYNIKNSLFVPDAACLKLWHSEFRGLQYKILFMPGLDMNRRKEVLKLIIKSFYYPLKFRK